MPEFTEEEILVWAEIENYKYFAQKGPEPVSHGRSWGLASRTLRHLLDESAEDLVRPHRNIPILPTLQRFFGITSLPRPRPGLQISQDGHQNAIVAEVEIDAMTLANQIFGRFV